MDEDEENKDEKANKIVEHWLESNDGVTQYRKVEFLSNGSFGEVFIYERQEKKGGNFIGFFAGKIHLDDEDKTKEELQKDLEKEIDLH